MAECQKGWTNTQWFAVPLLQHPQHPRKRVVQHEVTLGTNPRVLIPDGFLDGHSVQ